MKLLALGNGNRGIDSKVEGRKGLLPVDGWALDDSGFREALRLGADRCFAEADLRVQYEDHGGKFHHQVFVSGRLEVWQPGAIEAPELWLRLSQEDQRALFTRVGLGEELLAATEVVDPRTGGGVPPAPRDEVEVRWFEALRELPAVPDLKVQQVLMGSPFGEVVVSAHLVAARIVDIRSGPVDDADVTVVRRYGLALRERAGELDLLESLEGGEVRGELRLATLFMGIYEMDECVAARQAMTTPWCEPLYILGEILSSPEWAAVAAELRGEPVAQGEAPTGRGFDPEVDVVVSVP